eukprot:3317238-Rhodomonas_salina.1
MNHKNTFSWYEKRDMPALTYCIVLPGPPPRLASLPASYGASVHWHAGEHDFPRGSDAGHVGVGHDSDLASGFVGGGLGPGASGRALDPDQVESQASPLAPSVPVQGTVRNQIQETAILVY